MPPNEWLTWTSARGSTVIVVVWLADSEHRRHPSCPASRRWPLSFALDTQTHSDDWFSRSRLHCARRLPTDMAMEQPKPRRVAGGGAGHDSAVHCRGGRCHLSRGSSPVRG